jgi:hypothetical protein
MDHHFFLLPVLVTSVHVELLSMEVQILPPLTTAASLSPSLDDVMDVHLVAWTLVTCVHVKPLSVEVNGKPKSVPATSLAPSLDDVMEFQSRTPLYSVMALVTFVHVEPLSVEVQMLPPP